LSLASLQVANPSVPPTIPAVTAGCLTADSHPAEGRPAARAIARKLAQLIYRMLRYGQDDVDIGEQAFEAQLEARRLASLKEAAGGLGFTLVEELLRTPKESPALRAGACAYRPRTALPSWSITRATEVLPVASVTPNS
jgi:hypothetical protein